MTIAKTDNRNQYTGDGTTTAFAFQYRFFADSDLGVYVLASGVETKKTLTTHYTVSNTGTESGGTVTFGTAPASGVTVTIIGEIPYTQTADYADNDAFPAATHETALDRSVRLSQRITEVLDRAITVPASDTASLVLPLDRVGKVVSFDASNNVIADQELGTHRGNWAASTAYLVRDIVTDASNNNVYICLTAHTSSGSTPISGNADAAKWRLVIDAAAVASSASAAAASASAAATSETNAATSATNAATSATNAATSETNAATSETNAATSEAAAAASEAAAAASYDSFDDRYLGVKAADPTLDNDGNALLTGALYFNSTSGDMKVYNGSAWVAAYASLAGALLAANNLSDVASAATAATNLGLGTGNTPQFTGIELGHVTDTTLSRVSAGVAAVEGDTIATLIATQTLTNKTLTDPILNFTGDTQGDILKHNGTTFAQFAKGTAGQVLKVNSGATDLEWGSAGAVQFISSTDVSAAAYVDLTLDNSLYDFFTIKFGNLKPATDNVDLWLRTSTNGGATFDATAADYFTAVSPGLSSDATTNAGVGSEGLGYIFINGGEGIGNLSSEHGISGEIHIHTPGLGKRTHFTWNVGYQDDLGHFSVSTGGAMRAYGVDTDAVRLLFSSGNMTEGTINLYGWRNA